MIFLGDRTAEQSFSADRTAPRAATDWFRMHAAALALPAERLAEVELCLDELVTNIVRHGGERRRLTFRVSLRQQAADSTVTVEDDGPPFDPLQAPAPLFTASLDDAPEGGRGIFLIRSIADEVRYENREGVNCVTLVFREE